MKIRRVLCWLLSLALLTGSIYTADTLVRQRRLARKTVRLHVIANSDEAADQAQKLRVRDGVLACVSGLTADCETADDARKCIAAHLPEIAEAAQRVLAGSGYDVTVSLGPETYGTRDYASFSLPAGTYPSLRVQIGEAAGKNWWCVVFPVLCMSASADELEQVGLDIPQVTKVALILRQRGLPVDTAVYTVEALRDALLRLKGGDAVC